MRINRTNPDQPGSADAACTARRSPHGFELPQQDIPKENQKENPKENQNEPPKAAKPPKPKKKKPAKKPRREPEYEEDDDDEEEPNTPPFPVWLPDCAHHSGAGGLWRLSRSASSTARWTAARWVPTRPSPSKGSSVTSIATQLKDAGIIQYDWLFKQYVKYSGKADDIQYGDFEVRRYGLQRHHQDFVRS